MGVRAGAEHRFTAIAPAHPVTLRIGEDLKNFAMAAGTVHRGSLDYDPVPNPGLHTETPFSRATPTCPRPAAEPRMSDPAMSGIDGWFPGRARACYRDRAPPSSSLT